MYFVYLSRSDNIYAEILNQAHGRAVIKSGDFRPGGCLCVLCLKTLFGPMVPSRTPPGGVFLGLGKERVLHTDAFA